MRALVRARPDSGVRSIRRALPRRRRAVARPGDRRRACGDPAGSRRAPHHLAVALAAVALTAALAPATAAGAAACGSALPGHASAATLKRAMTCVLTRERRRHGLRRLRSDRHLTRAAMGHAVSMERGGVFSHGDVVLGRVRAAGFAGHVAGEALAWGCADGASAAAVMRSWLHSPRHRAIVLGAGWRSVGVGVVAGTPGRACADGGTWVLEVGR